MNPQESFSREARAIQAPRSPVTVALVTLVILALLYPFSLGPLILLMGGDGSDELTRFLVEQYHPWVYWLYDIWPSSGPWVDNYIDLWLSLR